MVTPAAPAGVLGPDRLAAAAMLRECLNRHDRDANIRRSHRQAVIALVGRFGADVSTSVLDTEEAADAIAELFAERWGAVGGDPIRALGWSTCCLVYQQAQEWLTGRLDPLRRVPQATLTAPPERALPRGRVQELLPRRSLPLRKKLLYAMLYETSARVAEVLALNAEDLNRPDRDAKVIAPAPAGPRRFGIAPAGPRGSAPVVRRSPGPDRPVVPYRRAAAPLPQGRTRGPSFLTDRRPRGNTTG